ncbi:hypothetical protein M9H77_18701 [Catharanthus roseus]|uniref:Uncharacterized protein n=1 Tax=Catharanthus roseus TaxID=4058 RepID=A0ACC0B8E9_CATRO|nr:hypothetical protein M9H77_18701 [Catharanthus roseus]
MSDSWFFYMFDLHSTLAIAPSQVPTLQFPLSSLLSSPPPPSHCRLTDILPPPPSHCQFEYGFGIFFCILSLEDVVAVVLDSVKSSSFDRGPSNDLTLKLEVNPTLVDVYNNL